MKYSSIGERQRRRRRHSNCSEGHYTHTHTLSHTHHSIVPFFFILSFTYSLRSFVRSFSSCSFILTRANDVTGWCQPPPFLFFYRLSKVLFLSFFLPLSLLPRDVWLCECICAHEKSREAKRQQSQLCVCVWFRLLFPLFFFSLRPKQREKRLLLFFKVETAPSYGRKVKQSVSLLTRWRLQLAYWLCATFFI